MKQIDVAIAVIFRNGEILICQRKADNSFGGLWEFPGGKREAGETIEQCLARELREELNITAPPTQSLTLIEHQYTDRFVRLHPYFCELESGQPQPLECQAIRWVSPPDLRNFPFPPANESLIEEIITRFPLNPKI